MLSLRVLLFMLMVTHSLLLQLSDILDTSTPIGILIATGTLRKHWLLEVDEAYCGEHFAM